MEKCRYLETDFLQKGGVVRGEARYLANPVACLSGIDDHGKILVIGTQHELGKEAHLLTVASFGLHLVVAGSAEVFQTLGVLALVEQHLVNYDYEFAVPVVVELAPEILVCVEGDIRLKEQFEEIEEGGFAGVALLRHQQQYRKFLQRHGVESLQVIETEVVLFAEDMAHKRFDAWPFSLGGDMAQRRILVFETADNRLIVQMRRDTAEAVVFGHVGKEVLTVVLTDCLDCPRDAALYQLSGGVGLSDNLVVGGADALEAVFGFRGNSCFIHRLSLHCGIL